ncbi:MAG: hypothetical protein B7X07_00260 [Actinobacteria bacterium 21-64-8]|nr:MAG: hypothetical protein B7X07_00260 [Actinobacteria bacterium 21-64-8]
MNVARVATSSALGIALAVGGTSVAFAHGAKDHGRSNDHHAARGHRHGVDGTISALSATTPGTLTLTMRDGSTVTYTTTAATTYFEGRASATSSALAVGEQVDVALNATTPTTLDSVRIDLTHFEGKILAITGAAGAATITLSGPNNTTRTVLVTPSTTFEMKGQTATFSSLVVGAEMGAMGLDASNNTLSALSIRVSAPESSPQQHSLNNDGGRN